MLASALGTFAALGLPLGASVRPALAGDPPVDHPPSDDYIGYVLIPRYFPETRHNVNGAILDYFRANGEAAVFGYPLTEEFWEPAGDGASAAGGPDGHMVQYFQCARLEYDLDARVVRRSPLGDLLGRRQPAVEPLPGLRYYPETGHNLGGAFLQFFDAAGGRDALGYPISEEVPENGHIVQWFQNARLEWWPENPPGAQVQYGLIGTEALRASLHDVPVEALRPAQPLEPLRQWVLPPPPPAPARRLPPQHLPILYYHQVPSQGPLRAQIRAFKDAGRTFLSLGRAVQALRGEASLPDRPLVLTFDDSWASQIANAAPVLQAEGIQATFFVITRFLGTMPGYMTWDQVRALKEMGHEVESHTQNHADVVDLLKKDQGAAIAEIWESLAILEDRLGRSQRLFAYPNGSWNNEAAALVARVYRAAAATGGGDLQSQDRLYALRRIKAEPSYPPEMLLKQMAAPEPAS